MTFFPVPLVNINWVESRIQRIFIWTEREPSYGRETFPFSKAKSALKVTFHFARNGATSQSLVRNLQDLYRDRRFSTPDRLSCIPSLPCSKIGPWTSTTSSFVFQILSKCCFTMKFLLMMNKTLLPPETPFKIVWFWLYAFKKKQYLLLQRGFEESCLRPSPFNYLTYLFYTHFILTIKVILLK